MFANQSSSLNAKDNRPLSAIWTLDPANVDFLQDNHVPNTRSLSSRGKESFLDTGTQTYPEYRMLYDTSCSVLLVCHFTFLPCLPLPCSSLFPTAFLSLSLAHDEAANVRIDMDKEEGRVEVRFVCRIDRSIECSADRPTFPRRTSSDRGWLERFEFKLLPEVRNETEPASQVAANSANFHALRGIRGGIAREVGPSSHRKHSATSRQECTDGLAAVR